MLTIAVISLKGGAGKTTMACHLAAHCQRHSPQQAALLDLDAQGSAYEWNQTRLALPIEASETIEVQAVALPRLSEELALLRAAEQETGVPFLAILDTPAGDSSVAQAAAQFADMAVVPCRPAQVDLLSLDYTLRLCRLVGVPCYGVINAAKPYGEHTEAARRVLRELGVVTAPTELGDRVAFQHAFRQGRGVTETEPQSKAAVELELLYAWLMKQWAAESAITSRSTS